MHLKRLFGVALLATAIGIALPARGTVPTGTGAVTFVGNGSTATFSIPFKFLANSDLSVTWTDTSGSVVAKNLGADYSVTGAGGTSGTLTFTSAPPSGYVVQIRRILQLTQPTSLKSQTTFSPTTHENALDRLAMQVQQVNDTVNGANLNVVVASGTAVTATSSTNPRSLAARFADIVNVKDFGAKGDGTTDDTSPIQAALNAVPTTGGVVYFPPGTYHSSTIKSSGSVWTVKSGTIIRGAGRGSTLLDFSGGGITGTATAFTISGGWGRIENLRIQYAGVKFGTGSSFRSGMLDVEIYQPVAGIGLEVSGTYSLTFRDVSIYRCNIASVKIHDGDGAVTTLRFEGLHTEEYANSYNVWVRGDVTQVLVLGSTLEANYGTATAYIESTATKSPAAITFDHVHFETSQDVNANTYALQVIPNGSQKPIGVSVINGSSLGGSWKGTGIIDVQGGTDIAITDVYNDTNVNLLTSTSYSSATNLLVGRNRAPVGKSELSAPRTLLLGVGVAPGAPTSATTQNAIYSGSGAPSNANGANGDFYFRTDTPGTANQRLYVKSAGSWVGIL